MLTYKIVWSQSNVKVMIGVTGTGMFEGVFDSDQITDSEGNIYSDSDYIIQMPPVMNVHLGLWSDNLYFTADGGNYDSSLDYSSAFNNFVYIGMTSSDSYTFSSSSTLSGSPFRAVNMF
jgi:hypothetical protein